MISCEKVQRILPLHAGGDLRGRQEHEIDEHLSGCLGCYRLYQDYLEGVVRLRASREPFEVAPDFWTEFEQDVMVSVREETSASTVSTHTLRLAANRPLIGAAASFFLALTAWFVFDETRSITPDVGSPPPVAANGQHIIPIYDTSLGAGLERVGVRRSVSTREEAEVHRLMRRLDHPGGPEELYELERVLSEYGSEAGDGFYR